MEIQGKHSNAGIFVPSSDKNNIASILKRKGNQGSIMSFAKDSLR